jgi:hypothetical protein
VQRVNLAEAVRLEPALALDVSANTAELCGVRVTLGPKLFALLRLMAEARRGVWTERGGALPPGWLTLRRIATGAAPDGSAIHAHFRRYLQAAIAAAGGDPDDREDRVLASWDEAIAAHDAARRTDWIAGQLRPNLRHLADALEEAFGEVAASELMPRGKRQAGGAPFGLNIPANAITVA